MPLARVPTHVNGQVVTEPERQLQRLILAGESAARIRRLMGLSPQQVTALRASLHQKGFGIVKRRVRLAARPARGRRGAADDVSLDGTTRRRFGAHLRSLRSGRGLTQAALASGAFTAAFVSMIESGAASPSVKSLLHFARRLGVPVRELIPPDL
jgi:DNA-binding CsgD family transcriptional regulator